ncbi:TrmB family transcriptional regulator [Halobacteriales archaeon QS_6_64_34]|nr:MAG: TrmB family transcriptional regulator [Halobacteriales archaeon QS_6_64_34]
MVQIDLTTSQRQTLTAVVNQYRPGEGPVKAQTIADSVDRSLGTIQNQMQRLAQLGVVEGVSGPAGGYEPTEMGFQALGREPLADSTAVTVAHGYERLDVTVDRITFKSVHHPENCRAEIHLQQSVSEFSVGQAVAAGPTPLSKLVVAGTIEAIDNTSNTLILDIAQLEAPVEEPE